MMIIKALFHVDDDADFYEEIGKIEEPHLTLIEWEDTDEDTALDEQTLYEFSCPEEEMHCSSCEHDIECIPF